MRFQCAERRRTRGPLGDGVWHFRVADWCAGCRRADGQIEHEHCTRWPGGWKPHLRLPPQDVLQPSVNFHPTLCDLVARGKTRGLRPAPVAALRRLSKSVSSRSTRSFGDIDNRPDISSKYQETPDAVVSEVHHFSFLSYCIAANPDDTCAPNARGKPRRKERSEWRAPTR